MLGYALAIFALGCLGGIVPLFVRRTERVLHLLIAVSTGILLGVVFQHLLPEVAHYAAAEEEALHAAAEAGHDGHAHEPDEPDEHGHDGHEHGGDEHDDDKSQESPTANKKEDSHAGHAHAHGHDHGAHDDHGHDSHGSHAGHAHSHSTLWLWMLGGLLALYFLEHVVFGGAHDAKHGDDHHTHEHRQHHHVTLGWASLLGFSVHAFTAGIALAAAYGSLSVASVIFFCIIAHKAAETFSLGTVFLLGGFSLKATLAVIVGFSLVTPLGMFVGSAVVDSLPEGTDGILTALAAGTFLFVAVCDLLPEVFHDRQDIVARGALLVVGVVGSILIHAGGIG